MTILFGSHDSVAPQLREGAGEPSGHGSHGAVGIKQHGHFL